MLKLYTLDNKFIKKVGWTPDNFTGIIVWPIGRKYWYLNGKIHRLDGPAIEYNDGYKEWHINGEQITKEQHKLLEDMLKLKKLT